MRIDPIPASARDAQRVALEMVGVDNTLLGATTSDLNILCPRGFTVGKHAIALRAVRHHESLSMPHLRPQ